MSEFRILVATSRPTMQAFFADMGRRSPSPVLITALPLSSTLVANASDVCAATSVAVVDASVESEEALAVCGQMRAHRPSLPITALFCCPHSATAARLRAFMAEGVTGFLDLNLSTADTLYALNSVARGHGVFRVELPGGSGTALFEVLNGDSGWKPSADDIELLKLLALGLTDQEIGRKMYLSGHTVKHRIERLRRRTQARNRVQLAAWAARQDAVRTVLLAIALTASGFAAERRADIMSSSLSRPAKTLSAPSSRSARLARPPSWQLRVTDPAQRGMLVATPSR